MLILLSVTTHTTSSAPKAHPPTDWPDAHSEDWKLLNLLRWTRFYRLKDSIPEHICFKGRKMSLSVEGICDVPLPLPSFWSSVSHQSGRCWLITARKAKYWSQRESRISYPHQRAAHTYLQRYASAKLPAPDGSVPIHRSSSDPVQHMGASSQ